MNHERVALGIGLLLFSVLSHTTHSAEKQRNTVNLPGVTITKKEARRQEIEDSVQRLPRKPKITSRDRQEPPSVPHNVNGAIDFRSKNVAMQQRHAEASLLSRQLGRNYTVIVEEPHKPARGAFGPSGQINSAYRNGQAGNVRTGPTLATEIHTHVQPQIKNPR